MRLSIATYDRLKNRLVSSLMRPYVTTSKNLESNRMPEFNQIHTVTLFTEIGKPKPVK